MRNERLAFTPDQCAKDPKVDAVEFNPQAARSALAIGWRDSDDDGFLDRGGTPFAFTLLIPRAMSRAISPCSSKQRLREIGIRMEISTMDNDGRCRILLACSRRQLRGNGRATLSPAHVWEFVAPAAC